jgi:hypothetical protein
MYIDYMITSTKSKALLIFNAINDGWTVKKVQKEDSIGYSFTRKNDNVLDVSSKDSIKDFLDKYHPYNDSNFVKVVRSK